MCLIAYQPPGDEPFNDDILANGWDHNHDGSGYMLAVDGKLIVRKPFFKLAELREAYQSDHAAHGAASAFIVHFRWSTHGKKDEVNTHPHILAGGRAALVHNGILHEFAPGWNADISDTVMFCRTVLAHRQPSQLTGRKFGRYLAGMIGERNKLALMDYLGNVSIVNSDAGTWDGGRWYSNGDYKSRAVVLPPKGAVFSGYSTGAGYCTGGTGSACNGAAQLPAHYRHRETLWEYPGSQRDAWDDSDADWEAPEAEDMMTIEEADRLNDIMDELVDAALAKSESNGDINWDDIEVEAQRRLDAELAST